MAKILLGLNAEKIDENIASNFEGVGLISIYIHMLKRCVKHLNLKMYGIGLQI